MLENAAPQLGRSARFVKVLRVTRTLADLEGDEAVATPTSRGDPKERMFDRRAR